MLIIGLTGGIGSGKTTVAQLFSQLGVPIISADIIAAQLTKENLSVIEQLQQRLPADYFNAQGQLHRKKLQQLIFTDTEEKKWLEALLHPHIWDGIIEQMATLPNVPYCIVEVPLLTEAKTTPIKIDRVLVIDVPLDVQLERVKSRERDNTMIENIINQQATREQRLAIADDIIKNTTDLETLRHNVEKLNKKYIDLSQKAF